MCWYCWSKQNSFDLFDKIYNAKTVVLCYDHIDEEYLWLNSWEVFLEGETYGFRNDIEPYVTDEGAWVFSYIIEEDKPIRGFGLSYNLMFEYSEYLPTLMEDKSWGGKYPETITERILTGRGL